MMPHGLGDKRRLTVRRLGQIPWFLSALRRACAFHHVPYATALLRSVRLFAGNFALKEIIAYGLFVPAIRHRLPVLVGKRMSLVKLETVNSPALQHQTEAKDEFHLICRNRGLPVPETYGWTRSGRRFDAEGAPIDGATEWARYLHARLPEDFVVKDRAGAYGSGFRAFRRVGDVFREVGGHEAYDLDGLVESLSAAGKASGIIIQERLFDAAPLTALSGRHGLQTIRVNTLLHRDGRVSVLFYWVKILAGRTLTDNFAMGTTGNLVAFGDPEQGVLRGALNVHECGSGMQKVTTHPLTGAPFDGFRVPWWPEAVDLARAGQRVFADLPTLGWDIALTEDGPRLIEANARWDPPLYAPFLMSAENWSRVFGGPRPDLR